MSAKPMICMIDLVDTSAMTRKTTESGGIAKYAIWQTTQTVTQAEDAEGYLYDSWVRSTGTPPFANRNKPPKSKLTDDQILAAKLKQIMSEYSTLARSQR